MTTLAPPTGTDILLSWIGGQQRRIHGILAGLDEKAMRRAALPSGWSCAGMVQHLTLTTRFWLMEVMAGQAAEPRPDDDFGVSEAASTAGLLEAYEGVAQEGAELVRDLPLATPPAWWPEGRWGGWRLGTLNEVLIHLLVETTCHAGHLDAARELIDGRTWDYSRGRLTEAT